MHYESDGSRTCVRSHSDPEYCRLFGCYTEYAAASASESGSIERHAPYTDDGGASGAVPRRAPEGSQQALGAWDREQWSRFVAPSITLPINAEVDSVPAGLTQGAPFAYKSVATGSYGSDRTSGTSGVTADPIAWQKAGSDNSRARPRPWFTITAVAVALGGFAAWLRLNQPLLRPSPAVIVGSISKPADLAVNPPVKTGHVLQQLSLKTEATDHETVLRDDPGLTRVRRPLAPAAATRRFTPPGAAALDSQPVQLPEAPDVEVSPPPMFPVKLPAITLPPPSTNPPQRPHRGGLRRVARAVGRVFAGQ
jgi:hypothetical protein